MNVKKQFEELYALLEANQNKKISTVMPQLVELMSRKAGGANDGKNHYVDDNGTTWVFCYYHKKWESTLLAEYGQKKGTSTGLNTMCKEGVSAWTKQQRTKKQAEAGLLAKVSSGELDPSGIGAEMTRIAEEAKTVEPRSDEHGFDALVDITAE
jgi:hypothetical protein